MDHSRKENDYYDILEIPRSATQREIHDAFRRAKATYSNDNPALYSMFTREEAQELMKMIEEAYEVLGNQRLRQSYDQQLMMAGKWDPNLKPVYEEKTAHVNTSPRFETPTASAEKHNLNLASDKVLVEEKSIQFEDGTTSVIRTKVRPQMNSEGMGQTLVGTYQVKPEFEEEIKNCENCDGNFLQKVRIYKNIDLDQLSAATKVSRNYLDGVEKMDPNILPAPVFVRGFVSHMARVLGLNEKKVTDSYMKILKTVVKK